jgi:hypothetical protein
MLGGLSAWILGHPRPKSPHLCALASRFGSASAVLRDQRRRELPWMVTQNRAEIDALGLS